MGDLNPNRANETRFLTHVSGADFIEESEAPVTCITVAQLGNTIYAQIKNSVTDTPASMVPAVFDTALTTADALIARMVPDGNASVAVSVLNSTDTNWFTTTMDISVNASKIRFTLQPPASDWPASDVLSIETMQICYMALAQSGRDYQAV
jgi:hypothetical protein